MFWTNKLNKAAASSAVYTDQDNTLGLIIL